LDHEIDLHPFELYNQKYWYEHKRIEQDDGDFESIIKYGGLLDGEGGTGKSTTVDEI
jgi:hypothetical protein